MVPVDAVTCSEAGLALAAGVLGVRADLPVPREQGREGHDRLRKVNHEPLGPWRQESPRPWVAKPPSSPQPDPPSTHLPCRRRRAFFSRTHSRLFLTTPRLAILYGTLWGDRAVSKGTEQPKLAPRCSRAEKCGKSPHQAGSLCGPHSGEPLPADTCWGQSSCSAGGEGPPHLQLSSRLGTVC